MDILCVGLGIVTLFFALLALHYREMADMYRQVVEDRCDERERVR